MTTQNTEPENSDINEIVVQQSSDSDTPKASAEAEDVVPANEQDAQAETIVINRAEDQIQEEEPPRSFADYIEEFRQQESQFSSLMEGSQAEPFSAPMPERPGGFGSVDETPPSEPFSSLIPGEGFGTSGFASDQPDTFPGNSTFHETVPAQVEDVELHENLQVVAPVGENGNGVEKQANVQVTPASNAKDDVLKAPETSPLLRPSSRVRSSRQAAMRHHNQTEGEEQTHQDQNGEASILTSPVVEEASTMVETPVEEKPRPERRYRFDRRTPAASISTMNKQQRTEESKGIAPSAQSEQRATNELSGEKEAQVVQEPVVTQLESATPILQEAVHEQVEVQTPEAEKAKSAKTAHDTRRPEQDREREKAHAATFASVTDVAEAIPAVDEVAEPQVSEVALEDLPPLEYADLQAASSRRRRKRRSGNSSQANNVSANVKSATPEQPASGAPVSSSPAPGMHTVTMPVTPAPSSAQYSIQSGHTVSQMNKGNGDEGPFMGPEPSPARGSGSSVPRAVRPIRNEVQRVPAYPVRSEGAASSASVNHLANVVAQAIQTQSDRMVAELRRANQIPTNVSVSLPPFPSTERVGVFVDVANLLYSARTQRLTIDFGKLLDFLRGNRRLVRAHAYCPTSPQPGDDQMFLQAVKGLGYRITTKDYKTFSSGAKKADLDLDLCMDVVRLVDGKAVDCIVLVSGDSDFMPMLDYCSDHGVRVEVAAFDESMSATLRQSCDLFINLSMLDEIRA
ncbi:MAG TPA: NYN domain-containing protein [Ktedonobacteraceae bacterium]|nr:NYN domain-containing protein [Ktedonobacteraceae bacterium]